MRIVVVLPAPFEPRKPKTWPLGHVELEPVERGDRAEALDEAGGRQGTWCAGA